MPEYLGDIVVVVNKDELIPKFWNSYDSLKKELYRYKNKSYGIKRAMSGGNGRKLLVLFDSLPKRVQEKLKDPRKKDDLLEEWYRPNKYTNDWYQDYKYPDGTYLKPDTIEKLIVNANVLQAMIRLEAERRREIIGQKGNLRKVMNLMFQDAASFNKILMREEYGEVQHTLNTNYRRFKEQYKTFKTLLQKALKMA